MLRECWAIGASPALRGAGDGARAQMVGRGMRFNRSHFGVASALTALAVGLALVSPGATQAQDTKPAVSGAPAKAEVLTPEEIAEKEGRKACKVAICAAFHVRKPDGGDVTCSVLKTWRKEQLEKMISRAKVSWPWGRVKCVADLKLKREALIKAMTEPTYVAALDTHKVTCEVDRDKDGPAKIAFEFSPKVTFEKGKATKAVLQWGKIEAPALVKGAMWTATATDNTFNVLQGTIVEDINDFVDKKCMEVKDDWAGK